MGTGFINNNTEQVREQIVTSTLKLDRAPAVAPDQLQEAEAVWGQASQFDLSETNPRDTTDGTGMRVIVKTGQQEQPDNTVFDLLLQWQEISRETHDVVVTAEGGGDLSVTVRRIDKIRFRAPQAFIDIVAKATGVTFNQIVSEYSLNWPDDNS